MRLFCVIVLISCILAPFLKAQDNLDVPSILLVSVDTSNGYATLRWEQSTSPDIEKYIIYYDNTGAGGGFLHDTVVPASPFYSEQTFTHRNESVHKKSVAYSIEAVDSSGETSILAPYHSTIYLTADYDSCEKRFNLAWTAYNGWGESLLLYNVRVKENNKRYRPQHVEYDEDSDTSGYAGQILENTNYCFFIEAVNQDGRKSSSNVVCHNTRMPRHTSWINADYASITDDRLVKLSFSYDPLGELNTFLLMRSKENPVPDAITYRVDTLEDVVDNPIIYYDTITKIYYDTTNFYYRLLAMDACYNTVDTSNTTGNIVLFAEDELIREDQTLYANLSWTPYLEWRQGVNQYLVYRVVTFRDNVDTTELLTSLPGYDTSYADNITGLQNQPITGHIHYYIVAQENDGNPYFSNAESRSNTATIDISPDIAMPDAFTPNGDGLNDDIQPIVIPGNPEVYRFVVYDRWGGKVFDTSDSADTWDGTLPNGKKAIAGVYLYYVKAVSGDIFKEKRGTLVLIYPDKTGQ